MFNHPSSYLPSCIACGTALNRYEWDYLSFFPNPSDGFFPTRDGSDVFERRGGFQFNVCDACTIRAGEQHRVRHIDRNDTSVFWPSDETVDESYALPCILCGVVQHPEADASEFVPCYSVGFWESRIFDGGPDCLDATLCSPCLIEAGERYQVWYWISKPWGAYRRFWLHGM